MVLYYYSWMPPFIAQAFCGLLANAEKLQKELGHFFGEMEKYNMEWIFGMVYELAKIIRGNGDPSRKVNALLAFFACLQRGNFYFTLLADVYLASSLTKTVSFLLLNKDFQSITNYFGKNGYPSNTPFLHNLSYNFVAITYKIFELGSIIMPVRMYERQEYDETSIFKRWFDKLSKEKIKLSLNSSSAEGNEGDTIKQLYCQSLQKSQQFQEQFLYVFMEMLQNYLLDINTDRANLIFEILQYGQSTITGQTIARLIDIIAHHNSFDVRILALKMFNKMILWGDVEALLVINFTENVEAIIRNFWRVKGEVSIEEGRNIYPKIIGQEAKKLQFYKLFLTCLQNWAIAFPNHEFLQVDQTKINNPSPIYQLYKLLRQKKGTIFPTNNDLVKYQTQSRLSFLERTFRNKLVLRDMNSSQSQLNETIDNSNSLKFLQEYYDTHKELLLNLIAKKVGIYASMQKFMDFKQHFEEKVQSLELEQQANQQLDKLIQNGLQLIEIIGLINEPYRLLLHNEMAEKDCVQKIISICFNYYSPNEEKKFVHFYSEGVRLRKESLMGQLKLQLRSIPLEKDLKNIAESIVLKQFRYNYKQKLDRSSSCKYSDNQELNLSIFTRSKFPRESRDQVDQSFTTTKFKKKESLTDHYTPLLQESNQNLNIGEKGELIKIQENVLSGANSLRGSRQKKKLTITSKQQPMPGAKATVFEPLVKKQNKIQNSLETQSSRSVPKQNKQQQTKIVNKFIPFQQNKQYFNFIPNEDYKISYLYPSMLLFKSPSLTIERMVRTLDADRVKIILIIIPHTELLDVCFYLEDQQCILIQSCLQQLPFKLEANVHYTIQIVGEMRKIPLRMPTIAFFSQKKIFFEYILPFTINFFLHFNAQQEEVLKRYQRCEKQSKYRYYSSRFIISTFLFPQGSLVNLPRYLYGAFPLTQKEEEKQRYLCEISYCNMTFIFLFELSLYYKIAVIKGFDVSRGDDYNESMVRYVINFMAHLLGERQA